MQDAIHSSSPGGFPPTACQFARAVPPVDTRWLRTALQPSLGYGWQLRPVSRPRKADGRPRATPDDQTMENPEAAILCRQCHHPITSAAQRRTIDNAHVHTFANPTGIIYEIACFGDARGCGYIGPDSSEFTWFAGYVWRIAVCAGCLIHLGWRFAATDGLFFHGLITSRLLEPMD